MNDRETLEYIKEVLTGTRSIVVDAAQVGFNWQDGGDWAERLYVNNGKLTNAIRKLDELLKKD